MSRRAPKASPATATTTATPGRNRRRHCRAPLPSMAILWKGGRPTGPLPVANLSQGGLCLTAGQGIRRGRVVAVLLDVPGAKGEGAFLAFAQVVRSERVRPGEHRLALSFVDLPAREAARLRRLVAAALAETHPCLEFFDTGEDGAARKLVLADDALVVG